MGGDEPKGQDDKSKSKRTAQLVPKDTSRNLLARRLHHKKRVFQKLFEGNNQQGGRRKKRRREGSNDKPFFWREKGGMSVRNPRRTQHGPVWPWGKQTGPVLARIYKKEKTHGGVRETRTPLRKKKKTTKVIAG